MTTREDPSREPRPSDGAPVKVLSIAGLHHTGSTILAGVLGEIDGFFNAGELVYLRHAITRGYRCGCGVTVAECETWRSILALAFRDAQDAADRLAPVDAWFLARSLPRLLLQELRHDPELAGFTRTLGAVCGAVQAATGARVVVETSKRPAFGRILASAPGVDVHVVHLLRDPRAVAYSWRRAGVWTRRPTLVGAAWTALNGAVQAQSRRRGDRLLVVRYEDFVRRPREVVLQILSFLAEPADELPFVDENTVRLGPNHTVAGNDNRFRLGSVELRQDDTWRSGMTTRDALAAMATSWPLRRRWGYRISDRS